MDLSPPLGRAEGQGLGIHPLPSRLKDSKDSDAFLWHLGTCTRLKDRMRAFDSGRAVWEVPAELLAYSDQKLKTEHHSSGLRFADSSNDSIPGREPGSFPTLPSDRHLPFLWAAMFPGPPKSKEQFKKLPFSSRPRKSG